MEWIVFFGFVGLVWWRLRVRSARKRFDAAQTWVESRAVDLMFEWSDVDDEGIATMIRDELLSTRVRGRDYFTWATAETVGRLRRKAIRLVLEEGVRKEP